MKNTEKIKRENRIKRRRKVRAKIFGSAKVPRLSLYRSNKGLFIQLIDDGKSFTLTSVNDKEIKNGENKTDAAKEAGKLIAEKAKKAGIKKVVFDRGGYKYHGRVKAVAEGAREGGLEF